MNKTKIIGQQSEDGTIHQMNAAKANNDTSFYSFKLQGNQRKNNQDES